MAGHNDAKLLFSIGNINAYHIENGEESLLTPSGPQTLSLLMVPTSSPFSDLSNTEPQSAAPEEDFYLHLHLPPELDLSLPATTQVYHQPPRSYLIPRWDLGPGAGAFTRIEFPKIGTTADRVTQEDVDTFETILAQCTAFLENAKVPAEKGAVPYNPANYAPGEGYIGSSHEKSHGQIVLVDEENGSVVGELGHGYNVVTGSDVKPGSKNPVEIELPQEGQGNQVNVHNVSEEYLKMAKHPAYKNSTIVQNAAMASRLIVTGSGYLANTISSGAAAFTTKTKPNQKPMTFSPATQERVRKINNLTHGAVGLSAATVGQVGKMAQSLGAHLSGRSEKKAGKKGAYDAEGRPLDNYNPGILNKSMIAFSTIADGIEQSARQLLNSGSSAASTMVGHRYGAEAGHVAGQLAGGVKNVGLVYIDATGVSRKAVIKSVAKGMVVGKMPDGQAIVVGDGDGGQLPASMMGKQDPKSPTASGSAIHNAPGSVVGFGNAAPPSYHSGVGESLEGQKAPGYPNEKAKYS